MCKCQLHAFPQLGYDVQPGHDSKASNHDSIGSPADVRFPSSYYKQTDARIARGWGAKGFFSPVGI